MTAQPTPGPGADPVAAVGQVGRIGDHIPYPVHELTKDQIQVLASGGFDADLGRALRDAQLSKRLLLLRAVLDEVPSAHRARVRDCWAALELAERRDPAAVRRLLAYPTVGSWLRRRLAVPGSDPADWDHLGGLALAALLATGTTAPLELPLDGRISLPLPGLGELLTGTARRLTVRSTPDGPRPRLDTGRTPALRPLRILAPGSTHQVVLEDVDPLRAPRPDGALPAAAPRLTASESARWSRLYEAAVRLLRQVQPKRAQEVDALLRCLVPLVRPADGTGASATLGSAFGQVLSSRPSSPAHTAGMLVHELQHTKLYAAADILTIRQECSVERFMVPWRPGPRPFGAYLQGLYAHVALAEYWWAVALDGGPEAGPAAAESARCAGLVRTAAEPLRTIDGLTPQGELLAAGLLARIDRLARRPARASP